MQNQLYAEFSHNNGVISNNNINLSLLHHFFFNGWIIDKNQTRGKFSVVLTKLKMLLMKVINLGFLTFELTQKINELESLIDSPKLYVLSF